MLLLMLACTSPTPDTGTPPTIDTPEHSECLPEGESFSDAVCQAVVDDAGRQPTVSENKSGMEADWSDPRLNDPEYRWLESEINRCACRCCHTTTFGGAGVYFWDMEHQPVWIDSASGWSLSVFSGRTEEEAQTLPTDDIERLRALIEFEMDRRQEE
ncbi:MAG: hypothetical protein ACI8RZ_000161 [Myxococcota bacterium]|jgi:hypothetical protein